MSSQDVTNALKAYMGLMEIGLSCSVVTPAYQRTLLLRDPFRDRTYVTCDFWESEKAYEAFQELNSDAYHALDATSANLTLAERKIGAFEQLADSA